MLLLKAEANSSGIHDIMVTDNMKMRSVLFPADLLMMYEYNLLSSLFNSEQFSDLNLLVGVHKSSLLNIMYNTLKYTCYTGVHFEVRRE